MLFAQLSPQPVAFVIRVERASNNTHSHRTLAPLPNGHKVEHSTVFALEMVRPINISVPLRLFAHCVYRCGPPRGRTGCSGRREKNRMYTGNPITLNSSICVHGTCDQGERGITISACVCVRSHECHCRQCRKIDRRASTFDTRNVRARMR